MSSTPSKGHIQDDLFHHYDEIMEKLRKYGEDEYHLYYADGYKGKGKDKEMKLHEDCNIHDKDTRICEICKKCERNCSCEDHMISREMMDNKKSHERVYGKKVSNFEYRKICATKDYKKNCETLERGGYEKDSNEWMINEMIYHEVKNTNFVKTRDQVIRFLIMVNCIKYLCFTGFEINGNYYEKKV